MSFLQDLLQKKKTQLHPTETLVTNIDGTQFIDGVRTEKLVLPTKTCGFVIDTKPDKIPSKILDYLYLGSQDAIMTLGDFDIEYVLSVGIHMPETSEANAGNIINKYITCLDLPETSLTSVLHEAFDFIDTARNRKSNILVHCNAGVSRSATIVIAYLMSKNRMSFEDAYRHCKTLRTSIRPNDGFIAQLKQLERI